MTSKEVPSVATWGSRDVDLGLQHDVQGAALCGASRSRGSTAAAEDAAVELEEPPQAVRASAAEVTPAAARKLRREIRRSNLIISFPLSNTALTY